MKLGLPEKDRQQLVAILTDFRYQYDSLVNRYNTAATATQALGQQPDPTVFLQQRDDLVQSTRDALQRLISADSVSRVHTHVQGEKKRMKIYTGGAQ